MVGPATDVFISYKAEDRTRLQPLVDALDAEGFSVWWDAHIGGGTNWRRDIEDHLDTAKCVLVAWTKRSVGPEGDFVRDEAAHARRRGAYLPVRFDSIDPPLGFREIQAISLKGWHGDRTDARFRMLADEIRQRVSGEHANHRHPVATRLSRRTVIGGAVGAIAIAGAGGYIFFRPAAADAERIAVLPFANLSGDSSESYFSDGIAEELRSALTRVGMQVIGRTSSDAVRDLDAKGAAAKLDVANILTGSVRRSPTTIRINAQLVSGRDGVEKWAQSYDRAPGDAITIQTDIAMNVAQALSVVLGQAGRAALTLGGTVDSVAQDLILQSRQLRSQSPETFGRRVALATQAAERDPHYADAFVEKGNVLAALGIQFGRTPEEVADKLAQAEGAARQAIALSPRFALGYSLLGDIAIYRLNFPEGLRQIKKALVLAPNDAGVLRDAALNLVDLESPKNAADLADRAMTLDPLNFLVYVAKANILRFWRKYPEAIAAGRRALELAPERRGTHIVVGDALLLLGQPDKARAEYEAVGSDNPFRSARLAVLAARTGDRVGAERFMADLFRQQGVTYSYQYAEIRAQLGQIDQAFAELDHAVAAKDPGLGDLKVDPFLDPLRRDPRYPTLLNQLNFPT